MFTGVEAVVFDLDGTLIPTMQRFAEIASSVMQQHFGVDPDWARARYTATSGVPFFEQLEKIFPANAKNSSAAAQFESEKCRQCGHVKPSASVVKVLSELRGRGFRLAVSSNNFESMVFESLRGPTQKLFDVICGFRPGFEKGERHFAFISDRLQLSRDRMLFVGDSLSDLTTAHRCGVPFMGLAGTFSRRDFLEKDARAEVSDSFASLLDALSKASHYREVS
jgi:phosphoglycolate phosphatase-like HAD superfamily hydrolase